MSPAARALAPEPEAAAPAPALSERLRSLSRYVALVAEQAEALERGDRARLRELEEERAALEGELRDAGGEPAELLDEGARAVREHLEEHEALRTRWTSLEAGALRATRAVPPRRGGQGRYPALLPSDAQLDVRF